MDRHRPARPRATVRPPRHLLTAAQARSPPHPIAPLFFTLRFSPRPKTVRITQITPALPGVSHHRERRRPRARGWCIHCRPIATPPHLIARRFAQHPLTASTPSITRSPTGGKLVHTERACRNLEGHDTPNHRVQVRQYPDVRSRDISRQSAPMPVRPWECTPHRKRLTRRSPGMRPRLTACECLTSRRRGRSGRPAPVRAGRGPVTARRCHYHFQPSVDRKAPARGRFRVAILPPGKYPAAGVLWCQGTRQRVLGPVD